jgi:Mn-containing catalase
MSDGGNVRGPWNQGRGPWQQGEWTYIEDPIAAVRDTRGLARMKATAPQSQEETTRRDRELSDQRHRQIAASLPKGETRWSDYEAA